MGEGARLLMTQRSTALLLERARVRMDGDRVVYDKAEGLREKVFNIPHANLAVLFLGQGTSLSQSAARKLAEEGVYLAFTGTGGSPLHYGSLTTYAQTRHMHDVFRVATTPLALEAAKLLMDMRLSLVSDLSDAAAKAAGLPGAPEDAIELARSARGQIHLAPSHEKLMGAEARITKFFCKSYAQAASINAFSRDHGKADRSSVHGLINGRLDQGNYIAYGIAGAALWTLGVPASLSAFHGKTRAGGLVFDLADVFKDAIVLPVAFGSHADDAAFRSCLIDLIQDKKILQVCLDAMERVCALAREP